MKTIYLTGSQFGDFISKKYHKIVKASFKVGKTKLFSVSYESGSKRIKDVLFFGDIKEITIPDRDLIPLLNTFYGLPEGLVRVVKGDSDKNNNVEFNSILTGSDAVYISIRRALLFASVWTLKRSDSVKESIEALFSDKTKDLVYKFSVNIIKANQYPEIRPKKKNLDDQKYDYQFIAMGAFLSKYFFPDLDRMENSHRDWLYDNCNMANIMDAPEKFVGFEPVIAGYLIALKAANKGQTDIDFVIEKSEKFKVHESRDKFLMIYSAMYFIGLLESKADRYFFVASASKLFKELENIAWALANNLIYDICLVDAFDSIRESIVEPKKNVVEYYRIKNPVIRNREYIEYKKDVGSIDCDKVHLIVPAQAVDFLSISGRLNKVIDFFRDKIIVSSNYKVFNALQSSGVESVHWVKGVLLPSGAISLIKKKVSDNNKIMRSIRRFFKLETEILTFSLASKSNTLILMVEDFNFGDFEKIVLERIDSDTNANIMNVVVFNFAKKVSVNKNKKNLKTKDLYLLDWIDDKKKDDNGNSGLQSEVEALFKGKNVKIITKYDDSEQWEMVLLGIGALKGTDFAETQILDFRKIRKDDKAYETIARCFRDIIVYDKDQKYMFMNLS